VLSRADNERLTRVGPGTSMGELMRRYWIPAAFSHQIARPDSPPIRVRLLGEDLVLFRDTSGRIGMLDERCPHRTASLFFGRNEEGGLRCVYHGLKFDVDGACVDVPCVPQVGEEAIARIKAQLKTRAYPCIERGEVVWTYMGPPELKPEFPDLEWTQVPPEQRFATRHIQECNWLQGVEGGFDREEEVGAEGMRRAHQGAQVHGLADSLGTDGEVAAHGGRIAGVVNAKHDLHVDEQASEIEVRRADVDHVVDDRELGVELGRPIFEHLDAAPQQPGISVPCGRDRCIIVRPGRGDHARPAAPGNPSKPAEE